MQAEPDYESYSKDELIDVYENIDRKSYPARFKKVMHLLGIKSSNTGATEYYEEIETLDSDPINKAKRINDFFDSLSDSGSSYHSNANGSSFDGGDAGE